MPIRRWIRHKERSRPSDSSASRQDSTCWYTLSTRVPSRSNSIAGRPESLTAAFSEGTAARHGTRERQFVGVLEVAAHRQAVGGPRDFDPQRRELPLHVERRRLSFYIRVRGDDHLGHAFLTRTVEQLRNVDLVRAYAVDRRDHTMEHEVQAVELSSALDRKHVQRRLDDTNDRRIATRGGADRTQADHGDVVEALEVA